MAGKSQKRNEPTARGARQSRRISTRSGATMSGGNDGEKEASNTKKKALKDPKTKRQAKKKALQDLHAEVELYLPGKSHQGQARRKVTRKESKVRTQKRKALDRADAAERAERVGGTEGNQVLRRKRMRGSKLAFEDEVVLGSLIFDGNSNPALNKDIFEDKDIQKRGGSYKDEETFDDEGDDEVNLLEGDYKLDLDEEDDGGSKQDYDEDYGNTSDHHKLSDDEEGRYELYAEELNLDITEELKEFGLNLDKKSKRRRTSQADLNPRQSEKIRSATNQFKSNATPSKIARTMYRLSNFKSHRMAQAHGLALGAYARGLNKTSVGTLQEVAEAAPTAPQIYSSLGLVHQNLGEEKKKIHEELLKRWEIERREREKLRMEKNLNLDQDSVDGYKEEYSLHEGDRVKSQEEEIRKQQRGVEAKHLGVRIKLATKTFASYHVAALLCKMDYMLWLKAGDAAMEVANLHSYSLTLSPYFDDVNELEKKQNEDSNSISEKSDDKESDFVNQSHLSEDEGKNTNDTDKINGIHRSNNSKKITTHEEYIHHHTTQKRYWIEQAKDDYHSADLLHPPGITVPAKLAAAHMELGNLSEALTLLTDLKNASFAAVRTRDSKRDEELDGNVQHVSSNERSHYRERTELEKSYPAWLFYANLMLTIGHECTQWNQGNHSNENYMFRRWLRKYSESFDWRERRLQVLCLALEAAAGSKACSKIVKWTKLRARQKWEQGTLEASKYSEDILEDKRWQVKDAYELDRKHELLKNDSKDADHETGLVDNGGEMKVDDTIIGENCESIVKYGTEGKLSKKEGTDFKTDEKGGDSEIDEGKMMNGKLSESLEIGGDSQAISTINTLSWHQDVAEPSINHAPESMLDDDASTNPFYCERRAMFARQKMELDKFDLDTVKMKIVRGSHTETKQKSARVAVIQRHRKERLNFIGLNYERKAQLKASMDPMTSDDKYSEDSAPPLPLSASCKTVCQIASQLLKLCLGMGLYHGGRLVSESVTLYFKERAVRYEGRKHQSISSNIYRNSKLKEIIQLEKETYDDVSGFSVFSFIIRTNAV